MSGGYDQGAGFVDPLMGLAEDRVTEIMREEMNRAALQVRERVQLEYAERHRQQREALVAQQQLEMQNGLNMVPFVAQRFIEQRVNGVQRPMIMPSHAPAMALPPGFPPPRTNQVHATGNGQPAPVGSWNNASTSSSQQSYNALLSHAINTRQTYIPEPPQAVFADPRQNFVGTSMADPPAPISDGRHGGSAPRHERGSVSNGHVGRLADDGGARAANGQVLHYSAGQYPMQPAAPTVINLHNAQRRGSAAGVYLHPPGQIPPHPPHNQQSFGPTNSVAAPQASVGTLPSGRQASQPHPVTTSTSARSSATSQTLLPELRGIYSTASSTSTKPAIGMDRSSKHSSGRQEQKNVHPQKAAARASTGLPNPLVNAGTATANAPYSLPQRLAPLATGNAVLGTLATFPNLTVYTHPLPKPAAQALAAANLSPTTAHASGLDRSPTSPRIKELSLIQPSPPGNLHSTSEGERAELRPSQISTQPFASTKKSDLPPQSLDRPRVANTTSSSNIADAPPAQTVSEPTLQLPRPEDISPESHLELVKLRAAMKRDPNLNALLSGCPEARRAFMVALNSQDFNCAGFLAYIQSLTARTTEGAGLASDKQERARPQVLGDAVTTPLATLSSSAGAATERVMGPPVPQSLGPKAAPIAPQPVGTPTRTVKGSTVCRDVLKAMGLTPTPKKRTRTEYEGSHSSGADSSGGQPSPSIQKAPTALKAAGPSEGLVSHAGLVQPTDIRADDQSIASQLVAESAIPPALSLRMDPTIHATSVISGGQPAVSKSLSVLDDNSQDDRLRLSVGPSASASTLVRLVAEQSLPNQTPVLDPPSNVTHEPYDNEPDSLDELREEPTRSGPVLDALPTKEDELPIAGFAGSVQMDIGILPGSSEMDIDMPVSIFTPAAAPKHGLSVPIQTVSIPLSHAIPFGGSSAGVDFIVGHSHDADSGDMDVVMSSSTDIEYVSERTHSQPPPLEAGGLGTHHSLAPPHFPQSMAAATAIPVANRTYARPPKNLECYVEIPPRTSVRARPSRAKGNVDDSISALFPQNRLRSFKCKWNRCPAVLDSLETLRRHVLTIHGAEGDTNACYCRWSGCGLKFANSGLLVRHLGEKHLAMLAYPCPYKGCNEEPSPNAKQLQQHIERRHRDKEPALRPFARLRNASNVGDIPELPHDVPPYAVLFSAVRAAQVSAEYHNLLGPWVLRRVVGTAPSRPSSPERVRMSARTARVSPPSPSGSSDTLASQRYAFLKPDGEPGPICDDLKPATFVDDEESKRLEEENVFLVGPRDLEEHVGAVDRESGGSSVEALRVDEDL